MLGVAAALALLDSKDQAPTGAMGAWASLSMSLASALCTQQEVVVVPQRGPQLGPGVALASGALVLLALRTP